MQTGLNGAWGLGNPLILNPGLGVAQKPGLNFGGFKNIGFEAQLQ